MTTKTILPVPTTTPQTQDPDLWTIAALAQAVAEIGANGYTHQVVARPAKLFTDRADLGGWLRQRRGSK